MLELKTDINSRKNPIGKINFLSQDKSRILESYPMHSFNKHLWQLWQDRAVDSGSESLATIGGTTESVSYETDVIHSIATAGADYRGIIVGTGNTAASINDTSLASMITHGTGVGQLEYQASGGSILDNGRKLQLSREIINNSGSDITINEVGVCIWTENAVTTDPILIIRDVLDSPVTIANGGSRVVAVTFGVSEGTQNMALLIANLLDSSNVNIYDLGGSSDFVDILEDLKIGTGAGDLTSLLAGTGNTAFSVTDTDLANRITHGTGAGQLEYAATSISSFTIDAANNKVSFNVSRQVNNNSGSDITIREIGWACGNFTNTAYLINRKVLNTPVTVANGDFELLKWVFEYTM